jgi:dTDP-4-dehydrorhamnose reductase
MDMTPTTRVLVTGASGTLGSALCRMLASRCEVTGAYFSHPCVPEDAGSVRIDLGDPAGIRAAIDALKPAIIMHAGAMTDPDKCEAMPETALRVNFQGTQDLARLADACRSRMVYVSTDLVFDGKRGNYCEADIPHPLSIYGVSKLRGEEAVSDCCEDSLVVRSTLIYGSGGPVSKTFLGRLLENLSAGMRVQLFTDQKRNPILVDDLAAAVVLALERDLSGLYHVGGAETASRCDFGRMVCQVFGLDEKLIVPITMDDAVFPARRPLDATLNIEKFVRSTGFAPSGLSEGLARAKEAFLS